MIELSNEEEILVDTLKNRSKEAERMRNYAKQQQTISSTRPVTTQRPTVPSKTPPVRDTVDSRSGDVLQRRNAVSPKAPERPVVSQRTAPYNRMPENRIRDVRGERMTRTSSQFSVKNSVDSRVRDLQRLASSKYNESVESTLACKES